MSEYDDGFDAGILHQCMQERDEDARRELKQRAAAFEAIRNAVTLARTNDKVARRFAWEGDLQAFAFRMAANNIRRAIRAAIGSANQ